MANAPQQQQETDRKMELGEDEVTTILLTLVELKGRRLLWASEERMVRRMFDAWPELEYVYPELTGVGLVETRDLV